MHLLTETAVFLAAAVVTVPLFRRLRLGAVLGFLAAGLLIGPWGLRLVTDVELGPGTYVLEANFFADVFEKYENDHKVAPSDPNAGEAALFAGTGGTGWIANNYLAKNTLKHTFTVASAQTMTVGVGFRGRYAIANNGWFVDNLSLRQLQ